MSVSVSSIFTAVTLVVAALLVGFYFSSLLVSTLGLRRHITTVRQTLGWLGVVLLIVMCAVGAGLLFVFTGGMKWIRPLLP